MTKCRQKVLYTTYMYILTVLPSNWSYIQAIKFSNRWEFGYKSLPSHNKLPDYPQHRRRCRQWATVRYEIIGDFPRSFYSRLSQIFYYLPYVAEPSEEHLNRSHVRHHSLYLQSTYPPCPGNTCEPNWKGFDADARSQIRRDFHLRQPH